MGFLDEILGPNAPGYAENQATNAYARVVAPTETLAQQTDVNMMRFDDAHVIVKSDRVPMIMPDGTKVSTPRENMDKAIARGYKLDGPVGDRVRMAALLPTPGGGQQTLGVDDTGLPPEEAPGKSWQVVDVPRENYTKAIARGYKALTPEQNDQWVKEKTLPQRTDAATAGFLNYANTGTAGLSSLVGRGVASALGGGAQYAMVAPPGAGEPPPGLDASDASSPTPAVYKETSPNAFTEYMQQQSQGHPTAAALGSLGGLVASPVSALGGAVGSAAGDAAKTAGAGVFGQGAARGAAEMAAISGSQVPDRLSQQPLGTESLISELKSVGISALLGGTIGGVFGKLFGGGIPEGASIEKVIGDTQSRLGAEAEAVATKRSAEIDRIPAIRAMHDEINATHELYKEASVSAAGATPALQAKVEAVGAYDKALGSLLPSRLRSYTGEAPLPGTPAHDMLTGEPIDLPSAPPRPPEDTAAYGSSTLASQAQNEMPSMMEQGGTAPIGDQGAAAGAATPVRVKKSPGSLREAATGDVAAYVKKVLKNHDPSMQSALDLADGALEVSAGAKTTEAIVDRAEEAATALRAFATSTAKTTSVGVRAMRAADALKAAEHIEMNVSIARDAKSAADSAHADLEASQAAETRLPFLKSNLDQLTPQMAQARGGAAVDTALSEQMAPKYDAAAASAQRAQAFDAMRKESWQSGGAPNQPVIPWSPPWAPQPATAPQGTLGRLAGSMSRAAGWAGGSRAAGALLGAAGIPGGSMAAFAARHILGSKFAQAAAQLPDMARAFTQKLTDQVAGVTSSSSSLGTMPSLVKAAESASYRFGPDLLQTLGKAAGRGLGFAIKKRSDELQQASVNPQALQDRLSQALQNVQHEDPDLASQLAQHVVQRVQFLADKMPKDPNAGNPIARFNKWVPDDQTAQTAALYLRAADSPSDAMIGELKAGRVNKETVETLQTLYPRLYDSIKSMVTKNLMSLKTSLPYPKRVALSQAFGLNVEPTLDPAFAKSMNDIYGSDPAAQSNDAGGYMVPKREIKLGDQTKGTVAQRMSGG